MTDIQELIRNYRFNIDFDDRMGFKMDTYPVAEIKLILDEIDTLRARAEKAETELEKTRSGILAIVKQMRVSDFGDTPSFDEVLDALKKLLSPKEDEVTK